jgi:hypothetical protein
MEKKYHAWGAKPEGTGINARTTAMATGATAFHMEIGAFAVGRLLGAATVPLDGAACVGLPSRLLKKPGIV